ncbi:hypothetical protein LINGRAHAP2_LOCUS29471 [Linum grandiflorum]
MVLRIRFSVGKPQIAEDRVLPESKQAPTPPKRIRFRFGSHEQHAPLPKKMKKTKKKLKNSTITAAEKAGLVNPTVRPLKLRVLFNRTPEQVQPPPHDFGMTSGCSFQYVGPLVPPPPSHLCLLSNEKKGSIGCRLCRRRTMMRTKWSRSVITLTCNHCCGGVSMIVDDNNCTELGSLVRFPELGN